MRYALTFEAARELMATARDPYHGKPLENNTRLYERGVDSTRAYAVRLHNTDVVEILPNGRYHVNHGGWTTVTTLGRIRSYSPARIESERGDWYIRALPKASDPEPEFPQEEVLKVFHATDPGPEPVKSGPCDAGLVSVKTTMREVMVTEDEVRERDSLELRSYHKPDPQPTRARNVLAFIKAGEEETTGYVYVTRAVTVRTDYVAERVYGYQHTPRRSTEVQCKHCSDFENNLNAWKRQSYEWGRYSACLAEHGTIEAWEAAKKADRRRIREGRKIWRAWLDRNRIAFGHDGVTVDHNGYALRRVSEAYFKAERAAQRRERARQKECERREREQVQLEKFKARIWKRRGEPCEVVANRVASELHAAKSELQSGGE